MSTQIIATTAERLRYAIEYRGTTAAEVSKGTGISRGSLSQYISGKYSPKQDRIYILAKYLRVSPAWLMGVNVSIDGSTESNLKYTLSTRGEVAKANAKISSNGRSSIDDVQEIREYLTGALKVVNELYEGVTVCADTTLVGKFNSLSSANQAVVMNLVDSLLVQQGTVQAQMEHLAQQKNTAPKDGEKKETIKQ